MEELQIYHYKTLTAFNTDLSNGTLKEFDLCFIKDAAKIWTHGKFYGGLTEELIALIEQIKTVDEVYSEALNNLANSLGFGDDLMYNPTNPSLQGLTVTEAIDSKQDTLVSGTNIKTLNGESLLGSGDIIIGIYPITETNEGGVIFLNAKSAGRFSLACGDSANAPAQWAFATGYLTTASGNYALAGGYKTTASGNTAIAYGYNASATNTRSIALGDSAKSTGDNGVAIGCKVEAKKDSVALGYGSKAYGNHSISIGYNNVANADGATIMGLQNTANGGNSFCCGTNNTTDGSSGFAMGDGNRANGLASIAFNRKSECNADNGISLGYSTICNSYAGMAIGNVNEPDAETLTKHFNVDNTAFCIGNGIDNSGTLTRGNAFKVKFDGTVYSDNTSVLPNADYAEMFEWFDGNELSEDRVGRFVALKGNKIILASSNDKPIGVISAAPSIIGDAPMRWLGKYLNDEWGRPIYEDIEVRYTETISETDENGEVILKEVEKTRIDRVRKINPDYDPNQEYIPRENRKEWDAVGLLGKLLVKQDGTLEVGKFCKPNEHGIATISDTGYYVMEIISDLIARILFK